MVTTSEGLKKVIGIPSLTISIVGAVIGAGIFALPAIVSISIGAYGILGYVFCSLMMASIMLCYAEVGSRINSSGGSYAYVAAAFGVFPAYIVNWLYFFGFGILGSAALMNIIADSLSGLFPLLSHPVARACLFSTFIGFMIVLNVRGSKQSLRLVATISIIKLVPLLCIIVFGFRFIQTANLQLTVAPTVTAFRDTMLILFFAFAGFETLLGASGEIINPRRTVPLSIGIAGIVILAFYMLLQTVVQGVLGGQVTLFKDAPLAAVAVKIIGPMGGAVLLIAAAMSCFGNVSMDILATPRSLFAGAKDGSFPKIMGAIHPKFATPHFAIISYGLLILAFSVAGGFRQLAILASAAILLVYLAVICATMRLRKRKEEKDDGSFRAPGGLFTPLLGIVSISWLLCSLSLREISSTLVFIGIVCGIFFATKFFKQEIAL